MLKRPEVPEQPRYIVAELLAKEKKKRSVLVAGCGNRFYNIPNYDFTYCDKMAKSIEHPLGIKIDPCDLNHIWPYGDNSFDFVISTEVIEHCENPWHFMREVKRIAKKRAYISFPNNDTIKSRAMFYTSGKFFQFQEEHIGPTRIHAGHINPVMNWEFEYICNILNLKILRKQEILECILYVIEII